MLVLIARLVFVSDARSLYVQMLPVQVHYVSDVICAQAYYAKKPIDLSGRQVEF